MAFQEIADHTKNVIDIVGDKEHDKWHKIKEISLEIAIIVFAVSLSIWLHGIGEHRHEQQQVRSFLLGLKRDIRADINQLYIILNDDKKNEEQFRYLSNIANIKTTKDFDEKKFEVAFNTIGTKNNLNPLIGRYDGFKTSGKLTTIEDNVLLERVTSLYQSVLPELRTAENTWLLNQSKMQEYLENDFSGDNDTKHHLALLMARKGQRLSERMVKHEQLIEKYRSYIDLGTLIIKDIDLAYPGNEKSSFFSPVK
jgi:hypothetical protein